MKQIYKKKILFLVSAILCVSSALGQTIYNAYQDNYVQHKYPNKWYTIRNNSGMSQASKDMDTFDDETPSFKNTYTDTDIQAAHTYIFVCQKRRVCNFVSASHFKWSEPAQCAGIPKVV